MLADFAPLWIGAHAGLLGVVVVRRVLAHFGVGNA